MIRDQEWGSLITVMVKDTDKNEYLKQLFLTILLILSAYYKRLYKIFVL